jgi:tRNA-splicing ligase RtcB
MPIKQVLYRSDQKVPVKIWTDDVDYKSLEQLENIAKLPFIFKHIAVMPDVHLGIGATVGSVIATQKAIIPSAVGVDLGCGMNAIRLSITANDLPDNLSEIRDQIEKAIPLGAGAHRQEKYLENSKLNSGYEKVFDKIGFKFKEFKKAVLQLGTLGSGNHFIEICLDQDNYVWIMLHSGSRGIGNMIGSHYIYIAKKEMERMFIHLPDKDLAYLVEGDSNFKDYVEAVKWAQDYALENRRLMMRTILEILKIIFPPFKIIDEGANCHHNYIDIENHFNNNVYITRKGAIRAREGDIGIIPGSMGDKSYIVKGKGNKESFCSCSHGAGRRLSRHSAKEQFTIKDLIEQTQGIECKKDESVLDEIPKAYKPIDEVMENQSDLVEVLFTLKQVLNVKG